MLLDLKLPKVSGHEVLERLRARPAHAAPARGGPHLVAASRPTSSGATTLGANSYVRKPVDFDAFMEAARQLGHYWLDVNEAAAPEGPATWSRPSAR